MFINEILVPGIQIDLWPACHFLRRTCFDQSHLQETSLYFNSWAASCAEWFCSALCICYTRRRFVPFYFHLSFGFDNIRFNWKNKTKQSTINKLNINSNGFSSTESHDETRIEELHKKRNYLAAYCKLVVYNVIPIKSAADIFKHYLRVSTSIFKWIIDKNRTVLNIEMLMFVFSVTMSMVIS